MIILNQFLTDSLAMLSRLLKNAPHRVLIQVKDACGSADAVALTQGFEHAIDGVFIGVETSKDAIVASTESLTTLQTAIERSVIWSISPHKLEVSPQGFTPLGAAQKGWRFH